MSDFSKGENGVNLQLTKAVETSLKQLGVEMVSRNDLMLFMARNKVRSFRFLDSYLVKKIGAEFDSSLVLLGTVTEMDEKTPSIGLTFTALDTVDGAPVWSASEATSVKEQAPILGVGEAKSVVDLARPVLKDILSPLADIAHNASSLESRDYQLVGLSLYPGYVRGSQLVKADLKILFLGKRPTFIAAESEIGKSYLQYDRRTDSYQGEWFAPREDGRYDVDLRFEWGRERTVERLESVASYEVINDAPGLEMEIKKTIKIGQRLAFRNHVLILPRVDNLRPMAGWALSIKDERGQVVAYEEYDTDLPERMIWEGRGGDGFRLDNGVYTVGLEVWDLAGNRSAAEQRIVLQAYPPKVEGKIKNIEGEASLTLHAAGFYEFPLSNWRVELRSMTGALLVKGKGRELPATFDFLPVEGEKWAYLTVDGVDPLGNRLRGKKVKLQVVAGEKKIEKQEAESWVPDF
ncbi:hypothetical protein [Malonomonas rubra]|nr:hypothetical protein [Malonomonas rubra]